MASPYALFASALRFTPCSVLRIWADAPLNGCRPPLLDSSPFWRTPLPPAGSGVRMPLAGGAVLLDPTIWRSVSSPRSMLTC